MHSIKEDMISLEINAKNFGLPKVTHTKAVCMYIYIGI